jgi:hypothetical protein
LDLVGAERLWSANSYLAFLRTSSREPNGTVFIKTVREEKREKGVKNPRRPREDRIRIRPGEDDQSVAGPTLRRYFALA